VVALLLVVYRSLPALGLGLLPVTTGALVGVASVALGFGAVHGITLGFGITLIGESVDTRFISLFNRAASGMGPRAAAGAALVADGTPGDADFSVRIRVIAALGISRIEQLGLYSISGLIAAALVTRFVLPAAACRRISRFAT